MAEQAPLSPHGVQAEYWNSAAARAWTDQHDRQDRAVAGLADAALAVASPMTGERVLDIGCATGTTVIELATRVGPTGHVLGADIAAPSVALAMERIAAAGLRQAEVICADVATRPFQPASFDIVFSRLGVMFFEDSVGAFINVHRATKPGGRLALAVFVRQTRTRGHRRRWPRCDTYCRQPRRRDRASRGCSLGVIRRVCAASWRARGSAMYRSRPLTSSIGSLARRVAQPKHRLHIAVRAVDTGATRPTAGAGGGGAREAGNIFREPRYTRGRDPAGCLLDCRGASLTGGPRAPSTSAKQSSAAAGE